METGRDISRLQNQSSSRVEDKANMRGARLLIHVYYIEKAILSEKQKFKTKLKRQQNYYLVIH